MKSVLVIVSCFAAVLAQISNTSPPHVFGGVCLNGDTCGTNAVQTCQSNANGCNPIGCSCNAAYSGSGPVDCGNPSPICTTNADCGSNGECSANEPKRCLCLNGYTGPFCDIAPYCTPSGNECGTNGKCVVCTDNNLRLPYYCNCYNGYGGNRCEKAPVCRTHADCNNRGVCDFSGQPWVCNCEAGWGGWNCQDAPKCTERGFECGPLGYCDLNRRPAICIYPNNASGQIVFTTTSLILASVVSILFQ